MDSDKFRTLKESIRVSHEKLKPFRESQMEALRQYVGSNYSQNGSVDPILLNMIEMGVTTYLQNLVARRPQVLMSTHVGQLLASANEAELAVNEALLQMGFEVELRTWVLSAMFSVGILKVGFEAVSYSSIDGEMLPKTRVFAEAIMLDDWVHDVSASKWTPQQVSFCGHKYKMPLEQAKSDPSFDQQVRGRLVSKENTLNASHSTGERADELSREQAINDEEFLPQVELWDIWIPSMNLVVTFAEDADSPLREVQWRGPEEGPYILLGFNPVLGNIMPLPPVANWIDMHRLDNSLYTKLGEQASRQKTVNYAQAQSEEDARRTINASDGDTIMVQNPQGVKEARFGGADQATLAFAMNAKSMTSYIMGNLDAIAGLGSAADTLGQEQLIKNSSNDRLRSMQTAVVAATEKAVAAIVFWLFHNPLEQVNYTRKIPNTNLSLPATWPMQTDEWGRQFDARRGEFDQYKIRISPYSMQDVTPTQRLDLLRRVWREDIVPLTQLGIQPDVPAYLRHVAKLADLPEIEEIVPSVQTMLPPSIQTGDAPGKSPTSSREYVRKNVSTGRTPEANDQQMMQMLMSSGAGQSASAS